MGRGRLHYAGVRQRERDLTDHFARVRAEDLGYLQNRERLERFRPAQPPRGIGVHPGALCELAKSPTASFPVHVVFRPAHGVCRAVHVVFRPAHGVCRAVHVVFRPAHGVCRAVRVVFRPAHGVCRAVHVVFRPAHGVCRAARVVFRPAHGVCRAARVVFRPAHDVCRAAHIVFGLHTVCAGLYTLCFGPRTVCAGLHALCIGLCTLCLGLCTLWLPCLRCNFCVHAEISAALRPGADKSPSSPASGRSQNVLATSASRSPFPAP
jgi:hypothetical protein